MISGRCRRRKRDLLALPRQILRLVVGILTGHTQVGLHLSIMGLNQDPLCTNCSVAIVFPTFYAMWLFRNTQNENMGEAGSIPHRYRYCNSRGYCDIYKKNLGDSHWVSSLDWNHRGWLMDPHCGLSLRGDRSLCRILELGTWKTCIKRTNWNKLNCRVVTCEFSSVHFFVYALRLVVFPADAECFTRNHGVWNNFAKGRSYQCWVESFLK